MACQTFGIRYSPQINPRAAAIFIEHLTASKVVNGKKMIAVGNTQLWSFHRLHWHDKLNWQNCFHRWRNLLNLGRLYAGWRLWLNLIFHPVFYYLSKSCLSLLGITNPNFLNMFKPKAERWRIRISDGFGHVDGAELAHFCSSNKWS